MTAARLWILLLALTSALAGFAAGLLAAPDPQPGSAGLFDGYAADLVEAFDLDAARERDLRLLLDHFEADLDRLRTRQLEGLEPELVQLGDTYRGWIRDKVLPPDRRAEFDLLVAGGLAPTTP